MNICILVGNVGQNPDTKVTTSGTTVIRFSMATNKKRKDAEGNWVDQTTWHNVKLFGKRAEGLSTFLAKGMKVAVRGEVAVDKYNDHDGNPREYHFILADDVDVLSSQSSGRPAQGPPQRQTQRNDPFRPQQVTHPDSREARSRQPASQGGARRPPTGSHKDFKEIRSPHPDYDFDGGDDDAFGGYDGN